MLSGSDPDEAQKWYDSWDMLPSNFGIRFVDEFVLWSIVKDTILLADLFRNPNTGDQADRCPFLRKERNKETYACLIHGTGFKPSVCKNYLCASLKETGD